MDKFIAAGARTLKDLPKKVPLTRAQKIGIENFDVSRPSLPHVNYADFFFVI